MPAPINALKSALEAGDVQSGLWLAMASATVAEIAGNAGFDWCLIDAEHGPNTLTSITAQVQALAGTPAQAVVRVPMGEDWMLKQVLDLGVQTVVVPMVNTSEQAAQTLTKDQMGAGNTLLAEPSNISAIPCDLNHSRLLRCSTVFLRAIASSDHPAQFHWMN